MAGRFTLFILLLMMVGQACRPEGGDIVIKTDPEFYVSVREALGPSPRPVEIVLTTRESLPCLQSNLIYSYHKSNRVLEIVIEGFHFPDPCVPAFTHNTTIIHTSWFDQTTYHLKLGIGEFIHNSAVLVKNGQSLQLYLSGKDGFEVPNYQVLSLPDQAVWGRIDILDSTALHAVQSFLEDHIYHHDVLTAGHYGHFEIRQDGEVIVPDFMGTLHPQATLSFACLTSDSGSEIKDALQGLLATYQGQLQIKCWTSQQRVL